MSQENKLPSPSIEATESTVIPVIEEQAQVEVRQDITGKVHVSKTVTTETVQVEVPYTQENVVIDRIAVNEYVDDVPPAVRYEGEVMIVPVLQEVLVKKTLLVEELHITKVRESTSEEQAVTLRKEVVNIQRE